MKAVCHVVVDRVPARVLEQGEGDGGHNRWPVGVHAASHDLVHKHALLPVRSCRATAAIVLQLAARRLPGVAVSLCKVFLDLLQHLGRVDLLDAAAAALVVGHHGASAARVGAREHKLAKLALVEGHGVHDLVDGSGDLVVAHRGVGAELVGPKVGVASRGPPIGAVLIAGERPCDGGAGGGAGSHKQHKVGGRVAGADGLWRHEGVGAVGVLGAAVDVEEVTVVVARADLVGARHWQHAQGLGEEGDSLAEDDVDEVVLLLRCQHVCLGARLGGRARARDNSMAHSGALCGAHVARVTGVCGKAELHECVRCVRECYQRLTCSVCQ